MLKRVVIPILISKSNKEVNSKVAVKCLRNIKRTDKIRNILFKDKLKTNPT